MKFDYKLKYYNIVLLLIILGLNICGIFVVHSASNMNDSVVNRQIMGTLISVLACLVFSFFDYTKLIKIGFMIYIVTIVFLAAVYVWGATHNGAGRWIVLPVAGQVQPAEFAKIGIIVSFAFFFQKAGDNLNSPASVLISLGLFALPAFLVFIEPNLSTTIIFMVIFIVMFYAAGLSYKWLLAMAAAAAPVVFTVLYTFTTDLYQSIPFIQDYQKMRILSFLYPEKYSDSYIQQKNSIIAIASGRIQGKGLYNTGIESVKTGNFLIEGETDFIFAIIGEELGFRGCILIFIGFLAAIFLILRIGANAKDLSGKVICAGYAAWIGFQTFTNVAVATAIFPNTGVTLPFFSRGISSLLALYIGLGIVLNIGLQRKTY